MIVFRLCREKYSKDLSGKGAEISGGRWNSKGVPMIYTSGSRALCLAEIAVNIDLDFLPKDFKMVSIQIPDKFEIEALDLNALPMKWNSFPHIKETQTAGDTFIRKGKSIVMRVPSALVPLEFNFIINPLHQNIKKVQVVDVVDFEIDSRFVSKR